MVASRNGKKWEVRFYYGEGHYRKQKNKKGFSTKKEAINWQNEFLKKHSFSNNMTFEELYNLYIEDNLNRVSETTLDIKKKIFNNKILPYFDKILISDIKPIFIRNFHNKLLGTISARTGKRYTAHYVKKINGQLVAIFNFAVNFYNLSENPCKKAKLPKLEYNKKMNIWTLEEFKCFENVIKHKPISYAGFNVLFWTGMRVGEMLALTREDVDLVHKTININKSYTRLNKKEIIGSTKTPSSTRTISINNLLVNILTRYFEKLYNLKGKDRIFNCTKNIFRNDLERHHKKAGVKKIRIHDLRHSHASFLINSDINIMIIAKRLGHAKVDMTLNVYSHLYKKTEEKMVNFLNKF